MSMLRYHIENPHGHDLVRRIRNSKHEAQDEFDIRIRWIKGDAYPKGRISADGGVTGMVEVGHKTVRLTIHLGLVASAFQEKIALGVEDFLREVTQ